MKSLAGMQWASFGSPDMREYKVMKSPMDSRGAALPRGFLDLSRPWVSLGRICRKGSVAGWITSTGPNGKVLVIPTDRLKSLSRGPSLGVRVKLMTFNWSQSRAVTGLLTGHNTLKKHLHLLGVHDSPCVGNVGRRRKPRLTYYASARPWPHSDMHT